MHVRSSWKHLNFLEAAMLEGCCLPLGTWRVTQLVSFSSWLLHPKTMVQGLDQFILKWRITGSVSVCPSLTWDLIAPEAIVHPIGFDRSSQSRLKLLCFLCTASWLPRCISHQSQCRAQSLVFCRLSEHGYWLNAWASLLSAPGATTSETLQEVRVIDICNDLTVFWWSSHMCSHSSVPFQPKSSLCQASGLWNEGQVPLGVDSWASF